MTRTDPGAFEAATRAALLDTLVGQRAHVLGILEGLTDDQLHEARLPSAWSAAGLVYHLALDVEHYWFRCIVGGESLGFFDDGLDGPARAWTVDVRTPASEVLERYRAEAAAADEVIAATSLDAAPQQRDDWWGEWQVPDLRFVLLHVIAETACHAGHLDAVRELIDGRQWLAL